MNHVGGDANLPTGEEIPIIHWVLDTEMTVPCPLPVAWCLFKDIRMWYTEYSWEVTSGPAYERDNGLEEGQTLKLVSTHPLPRIPVEKRVETPEHYVTKILKVRPSAEIVSVLSGSIYDLKQYTAFYVWRLEEAETGTRIAIETYGEAELVSPLQPDQMSEYMESFVSNWHRSWSTAFANYARALGTGSEAGAK